MVLSYIVILFVFLCLNVLHGVCTFKYYKKSGFKPIIAFIPFYNMVILNNIIKKPWYWVCLYYVPIVQNIMIPVSWIELYRKFFHKNRYIETLILLTFGIYLGVLAFSKTLKYQPNLDSKSNNWVTAVIFGVVVASLIRVYGIEAYIIPSSSMEKTLMTGDFLFVSKWSYGFRFPIIPLSLPLFHDKIMGTNIQSYYDKVQIPYMRWFENPPLNHNITVFNYPAEKGISFSKKVHYVKRIVGVAGDTVQVIKGSVFIQNQNNESIYGRRQKNYWIQTSTKLNYQKMIDDWDVTDPIRIVGNQTYMFHLEETKAEKLAQKPFIKQLVRFEQPTTNISSIFPAGANVSWNEDFYGPLWIPKKGAQITLNPYLFALYVDLINNFDQTEILSQKNGNFFLGKKIISKYTFKQNYYWAMGDNRDNSADSRFWGFVPENHIVGRPVFIWMSIDSKKTAWLEKIRWERLFCYVTPEGKLISLKLWTISFILLFIGLDMFYRKRKKQAIKS